MKKYYTCKNFTLLALMSAFVIMPLAAFGQTRITMPKNKYKVSDDVELGRKAAAEVDRQFPILNDADATRYLEQVGRRLVAAIPSQFQQPAFNYRFKLVNARDINAFALPGGPMYVNRGMIEAAKNEGEMAGVMAHEISHVALRHATAQETKRTSAGNQILAIGAILGGYVVGGESGAQMGAAAVNGVFLRYSRDYETQADILGAQIMAAAG
ncbi:MAG TPA: M48 family metalloprotease, partial [Nitrosospira sp.]|nr:M48 family metalloprotease [Nitrosospira sp.]